MCDLGLTLGIAAGIANAAGQASAAGKNIASTKARYQINQAGLQRDFITQTDAANKDAYQASLEGDRARSLALASGAGMTGATAGLRLAEQSRQTALSIANAKDRQDAAGANYILEGKARQLDANSAISRQRPNAMSTFLDVATSGLKNYGAFQ